MFGGKLLHSLFFFCFFCNILFFVISYNYLLSFTCEFCSPYFFNGRSIFGLKQIQHIQGRIQGGGGGWGARAPLSEILGIDFYSGFREKNTMGVQFEILKNPGIYFYSGFRNKIQVYTFIVASGKNTHGGCNLKS